MKSKFWYFLLLTSLFTQAACGEKSDIEKKIQVSADKVEKSQGPDGYESIVATGHAVLTKGTLTIKGESIEVTYKDKNGLHGEVNVFSPDGVTTIQQKRPGVDRWIEGESRSVYLNLLGNYAILGLNGNAKMRQIVGTKTVDESSGQAISYNMRTDVVKVFAPAGPADNAMSANDAKPFVCSGEKFFEARSIAQLGPQIAKMMEGVSDRGEEFNEGDVGPPGTRFALAAASKDAVLVAVERGGIGYNVYLWFFIKEGDKWQRGQDLLLSSSPPESLGKLLLDANRSFDCKNVPSIDKPSVN
jgi:lipopolysaccharide transport protein LptA